MRNEVEKKQVPTANNSENAKINHNLSPQDKWIPTNEIFIIKQIG
jgi:hypothetical protein